ncbi:tRNA (guanine-N7-)-methyltransferase [bacterium A37T11]|nr:tRNA (guanine-N7-)-methyltransferase [bacterium A37T11]
MGKDKLRKFAEIATFENVFQKDEGKKMKGHWAQGHFGNNSPIILELACGKGEYSVNMALLFPDKNFIGVDYKGNRLWRGAKTAMEENIRNVAFLRIQIENIIDYFDEGEVSEIWITFPDPQPQKSREKKRLTAPPFLDRYKAVLAPGSPVHLKTDNDDLFTYTLEVLSAHSLPILVNTNDLYNSTFLNEVLAIKTYYERKYLTTGKNINYLKWQLL